MNSGISDVLGSVLMYGDRHFQRIDRLLQKSFILDFTFQSMKLLTPSDDHGVASDSDDDNDLPLPIAKVAASTQSFIHQQSVSSSVIDNEHFK
jgi:hypothetical protein